MGLQDFKITEGAISRYGVVSAPDRLIGDPQENKRVFDRLIRDVVKSMFNGLVDALLDTSAAGEIGAGVENVIGDNVQAILNSLKLMLDTKAPTADVTAALGLKADTSVTDTHVKDVEFDADTGKFRFVKQSGAVVEFDTALEKVATNWVYDAATQSLVLTLADGTTQRVSLSDFVTLTEFVSSGSIEFSVSGNTVTAAIKPGSVTDAMLDSALKTMLQDYVSAAGASEQSAAASAAAAAESARQAASSKSASERSAANAAESERQAALSEADAETYKLQAAESQRAAAQSESTAGTSATKAAASESNAAKSETNAGKSAEAAALSAEGAANSEKNAKASEQAAAGSAESAKDSETSAAGSASAAAGSASAAELSAAAAAGSENASAQSAQSAQAAQAAAEKARDEAQGIVGGDFVTETELNDAIAAIPKPESDVFYATYGVTTTAEIEAALQAGKAVYCRYGTFTAAFIRKNSGATRHVFGYQKSNQQGEYLCDGDEWSTAEVKFAPAGHANTHKTDGADEIRPGDIGAPTVEEMNAAIAAIPVPESAVFIANYGVTTCAELESAYQAGKVIVAVDKTNEELGYVYWYDSCTKYSATNWAFGSVSGWDDFTYPGSVTCINDVWALPQETKLWGSEVRVGGWAGASPVEITGEGITLYGFDDGGAKIYPTKIAAGTMTMANEETGALVGIAPNFLVLQQDNNNWAQLYQKDNRIAVFAKPTPDAPTGTETEHILATTADVEVAYDLANAKASTATYTVSVPASWSENSAGGYMQTVSVNGMLATDNPIADVILGADVDANALYIEAWSRVTRITTAANSITLYANGDAPETAFTIQLKAVR